MRLALTVAFPGAQRTVDVVIEADPATPVTQVAVGLERFLSDDRTTPGMPSIGADNEFGAHVLRFPGPRSDASLAVAFPDPGQPFPVALYVNGLRIPPEMTLLDSPIRDGTMLSVGGPEGCVAPEPGGLVELRVVSGPGAGSIFRSQRYKRLPLWPTVGRMSLR